jgi:hypothetical protein
MATATNHHKKWRKIKLRRNATGRSVAALSVIAIVLAAALVFSYVTLEEQITGLRQSGHSACELAKSEFSTVLKVVANITSTLQQQIQSDRSIIDALNSTQPAGYQGIIATLNKEITQDQSIEDDITTSFTSLGPLGGGPFITFCASVSNP